MSVAHLALVASRGWAATQRRAIFREKAENERLRQEVALLKEELRLKDERMSRVEERPHYSPIERMAILELRALRGWSLRQTAQRFLLSAGTVSLWAGRLNERGPSAILKTSVPINKFPDLVAHIVQRLKLFCPSFGYDKLAQVLARAGLPIGASTVRRMLRRKPDPKPTRTVRRTPSTKIIARHPDHVWHSDMTIVPTSLGLWTSVFPFSLPQRWPFCWWLTVVADQYSKKIMGFTFSRQTPDAKAVRSLMSRIVRRTGRHPDHLVTDEGRPYRAGVFQRWCRGLGIDLQFGAIGQLGSIAFTERLIQTIKRDCTRRIVVPYRKCAMERELSLYSDWYNGERPHTSLDGATPGEIHDGVKPASKRARLELRTRPTGDCAIDASRIRRSGRRNAEIELVVEYLNGRRHLPVVSLRSAA
jgi:putative transposase